MNGMGFVNGIEFDVSNGDSQVRADVDMIMDEGCKCKKDDCEYIEGNVVDVDIKKDDCEVRADVKVDRKRTVRLWGQIKDCYGKPVNCALIKLVKQCYKHGKVEFEGVAHTVTDCMGFYQFDICAPKELEKFRIIVSKPATGKERRIDKPLCDPCKDDCDCIR